MNDQRAQSRRLVATIRRRIWILLPCLIIGGAAAFALAKSEQPLYSSTAALLFQQNTLSQQLFGYATSANVDPQTVQATNLNLVGQPAVASATARALGVSSARISGAIAASAAGSSDVVNVTATDASPAFSARIANTYAQQFIAYRRSAERAQVVVAANQLQQQISRLRVGGAASVQISDLQTRLSQLQVLESLQTGDVQQAQLARPATAPSSPRTKRDTGLGLLAGLLVGLLAAAIAERLDQSVRDAEEVRELFALPVLGTIPGSRRLSRGGTAPLLATGPEAETFRLLRTQLRYFNIDRTIKSVLIASSSPGDGKSTVAWNLALAAATVAPETSVLIVDADLRAPTIAELAQTGPRVGLAELVTQDLTPSDVVSHVPIHGPDGETLATLDVITAGAAGVPNPLELIESKRLRSVISELHGTYDFIVFDAPPTSVVSDAIPLMTQVSGILLVVRLRKTQHAALRRLSEQISGLGAHALGLVLNDVRRNPRSEYDYGTYYTRSGGSRNGIPPATVGPVSERVGSD